ncbi:serine O-acetyltransferase [Photorhabdus sp. CRCIA-P01]|uniref:serine O-acetyltransferase n=1 Tax=Photorhabdus sp. CRCIA-P01 TaxID=2019570 RepID=UPI000E5996DF|nr:serine acetyltransferase [Photorhabdus sp. CRCIA-P01]
MDKYSYSSIEHLKRCLMVEVVCSDIKKFTWGRAIRRTWQYPKRRFNFWWRIANYLYLSNKTPKLAEYINNKLRSKYGCDIGLGAQIGVGLSIYHYVGLVITNRAIIGENFKVRQNTTIGVQSTYNDGGVTIGDNVTIGANVCIIGNYITIGNNVLIGAISFINKNISSNSVCYTPKSENIRINTKNTSLL